MPRGRPRRLITPDEAFAVLLVKAMAGERCPKSGSDGLTSQVTGDLARAGRIRIDVYPHNWRVVTIAEGPHKGKATAPPPNAKWKPYLTIEKGSPTKPQYTARISP
ncbi:hypothetical protein LJR220_003403 [Bradyrhizobium sp. LjRoot220]|uniref:hypothetical protein n=1 Tax=Bradyrhizobium sp. LjRoot220 TaxID=3342284 RepID=UPI003ECEBF3B